MKISLAFLSGLILLITQTEAQPLRPTSRPAGAAELGPGETLRHPTLFIICPSSDTLTNALKVIYASAESQEKVRIKKKDGSQLDPDISKEIIQILKPKESENAETSKISLVTPIVSMGKSAGSRETYSADPQGFTQLEDQSQNIFYGLSLMNEDGTEIDLTKSVLASLAMHLEPPEHCTIIGRCTEAGSETPAFKVLASRMNLDEEFRKSLAQLKSKLSASIR